MDPVTRLWRYVYCYNNCVGSHTNSKVGKKFLTTVNGIVKLKFKLQDVDVKSRAEDRLNVVLAKNKSLETMYRSFILPKLD